jgi:hypothetical protein
VADPVGVTHQFAGIANNDPGNVAIGESQLLMTVFGVDGFPQYIDFLFENSGPEAYPIARVYWDDGDGPLLKSLVATSNGPGVDLSTTDPGPNNVPGWNAPGPESEVDASAGAVSPTQRIVVKPGKIVKFRYELEPGKTFTDVPSELNPLDSDPRGGVHVIGFAGGGSEAVLAVPLPGTAWGGLALFSGLGVVCLLRSRQAPRSA